MTEKDIRAMAGELAELLGVPLKEQGGKLYAFIQGFPKALLGEGDTDGTVYCDWVEWKPDEDLNLLREVWKVLHERGLWSKFRRQWRYDQRGRHDGPWGHRMEYDFLNDPEGQVQAAIKVLGE